MEDLVALRSTVFDTQRLATGTSSLRFFGARDGRCSDRLTDENEATAVRRIFGDPNSRTLILEELGMQATTKWALEVTSPFTSQNHKPGDIDCVLCDQNQPQRAVALEFKRAKVVTEDVGDQSVNRIHALSRGTAQANSLARLGFNRTFLVVLVLIDGRQERTNNFAFRGASDATFGRLVSTALEMPLAPEVGILYIELVQAVEAPFSVAGSVSVGLLRSATPREQGQFFTSQVQNFMSEKGQPTRH
jgi:hypothetical protein